MDADITGGTATFQGEITNSGEPSYTERGFVYGTLKSPTIDDNKIVANGSGKKGVFSVYATNLPKKTYYVRAYATSPAGTVYGEEKAVSLPWFEIPSAGIAVQTQNIGYANWDSVDLMCKSSRVGGFSDWRLPTNEEMFVIFNLRNEIGGFTHYGYYWTSESYPNYPGAHYNVDGSSGSLSWGYSYEQCYGRAVRTLK